MRVLIRLTVVGLVASLLHTSLALAGGDDVVNPPPPPSTDREYEVDIGVEFDGSGTSPKGKDILKGCAIVTNLDPEQLLDYLGGTGQDLINFDPAHLPEDTFFHFIACPVAKFGNHNWIVWEVTDPVPRPVVEAVALAAYNSAVVPLPAPLTSPGGTRDFPLITQPPNLVLDRLRTLATRFRHCLHPRVRNLRHRDRHPNHLLVGPRRWFHPHHL